MLCPDCESVLQVRGVDTAWCPVHGGPYQILFWEKRIYTPLQAGVAPDQASKDSSVHEQKCFHHPAVAATARCANCGRPICQTCCVSLKNNQSFCPECISSSAGADGVAPLSVLLGIGLMCALHPRLEAIARCEVCKTPICQTCCFTFPGNLRLCPACATAKPGRLSKSRKNLVAGSLVSAGWVTLALVWMLAGGLNAVPPQDRDLLDIGIGFLVVLPALIGAALSISAYESRSPNPPIVWVGIVWNLLLLGGLLLTSIVGILC